MIHVSPKALDMPFRVDGTGRIANTNDVSRQMALRLRSIIGTIPNERVMRPSYGSGAPLYVHDLNDNLRASMLAARVKEAIEIWEPAVTVEDVTVESLNLEAGLVGLRVAYRLKTTGEVQAAIISVSPTTTFGWPS